MAIHTGTIPIVDLNPFTIDALTNPGPVEELLRRSGPVIYLPAVDSYAVARHASVSEVLADWQHFESGPGVGLSNFRKVRRWRETSVVLEADPPQHDAPRRVLGEILGPSGHAALRTAWAEAAETLVDTLLGKGHQTTVDGFADLALAFPLKVVPDAIGIAESGRSNLVPFSDFLLNAFGPRNELVRRDQHLGPALSGWVDANCQRDALRAGSWGAAVWQASDRGDITKEQAPLVLRSLFAAGVNTTVHALAALLLGLARHPEQWDLVRARPEFRAMALDEAVRWHSPIQTVFRTSRGKASVAGHVLPDNVKVLVCLGAANRDPDRWAHPNRFDLTRPPGGHLGFSHGIHACVGQHLARLESEALLTALAARVDRIELAGEPTRRLNNTLNALAEVPLILHHDRAYS